MFRQTELRVACADVANPARAISRDGPSRGKQGGFTLMATFHRPNMKPVGEVQTFRLRAPNRRVSRLRLSGKNRRPEVTLFEVGLFVLVASTAMAVASVSVWWMLVYLVVIVVIFVTPARWRDASSASESGLESDLVGIVDQDSSLRVDRADGPDEIRSLDQVDSDLVNVDPTGSMDSNLDLITAGTTKRRGRIRARKATNPANEPVTDCRPVAWIQVGPGKFIRAESGNQVADSAQVEEVALRAYPVPETPAEATPSAQAETEPLWELEPFTPSGIIPGEVGSISVSDDRVSGPVAEEYGITPSTFSPATRYDSSVEASTHDLPGPVNEPEVKATAHGEPSSPLVPGARDSEPFLERRRISRSWVRRSQRGIIRTLPRLDRVSWRSVATRSPNSRILVGSRYAPNVSRHEVACCAFRRMLHAQRPVRTRSPPRR
jgi:hypothetical protein